MSQLSAILVVLHWEVSKFSFLLLLTSLGATFQFIQWIMVIIVKILTAIVIVSSIALLQISDFVLNEKFQQNALPYFLYDLQKSKVAFSISIIFLRGKKVKQKWKNQLWVRKVWTKHFYWAQSLKFEEWYSSSKWHACLFHKGTGKGKWQQQQFPKSLLKKGATV